MTWLGVLREELRATTVESSQRSPERKLWATVVKFSLDDIADVGRGFVAADKRQDFPAMRVMARRWISLELFFAGPSSTSRLPWICSMLGVPISAVRSEAGKRMDQYAELAARCIAAVKADTRGRRSVEAPL